ncbi:MAG TPA: hypothetical protein VK165_09415 [Azonexus sp.]|nr:hypothetical protein [Azonexus sp.]
MKFIKQHLLAGFVALCLVAGGFLHSTAAQAGALTDYAENKIVDALFRGQSLGAPATWYFALYTACPTESSAGTEVSGGNYARVAVAASLANFAGTQSAGSTTASSGTGGTTSNNATITFPTASGPWGTINCWGMTDASTAGNIWVYTTVTIPPTITSGATPSFSAGAATIQVDN